MYSKKGVGPRMEPKGTPASTGTYESLMNFLFWRKKCFVLKIFRFIAFFMDLETS